jgi:hypothetical protein
MIIIQQDGAPALSVPKTHFLLQWQGKATGTSFWKLSLLSLLTQTILTIPFSERFNPGSGIMVMHQMRMNSLHKLNWCIKSLILARLTNGLLTLQSCINEILESQGDNKYALPQMGKEGPLRRGELPERLIASEVAMHFAKALLGIDGELDDE